MQRLETERLLLRRWQRNDLEDLFEFACNPSAGIMQGWKPHESRAESQAALDSFIHDSEHWAIVLKENSKVIGWIKTSPDENRGRYFAKYISYVLSSSYWGHGYMTEAVKRVVQYAFEEMRVDLLTVFHLPHNVRSKGVIERCGFEYEITIPQGFQSYDGQRFDSVCYSMTAEDYSKLPYAYKPT